MTHAAPEGTRRKEPVRPELIICLCLCLVVLGVYWQVRSHEFTSFDDTIYVTQNDHVLSGLSGESLRWALSFDGKENTYWHPLTWISHMLDVQIYGLEAGYHLTTNLILHIFNTMLLFLILHRATGARWKSAFVAALFALHPINVESVAWVAARKNVLSTCFLLLTIWFYVRFTERPSALRYTAVLVVFTVGLMAKPMLVTLPFLLFLFDYWPLGRFTFTTFNLLPAANRALTQETNSAAGRIPALIYEKIPLLALALIVAYLSVAGLKFGTIPYDRVSLPLRFENALVSYIRYIAMMLRPTELAFFYPFPSALPIWQSIGAAVLLSTITVAALRWSVARPWIAVGWLWYLGTLVPVIGIMQAGLWPAVADRWAYVPLIGIFIVVAWGAESVGRRLRLVPAAYAAAGFGVLAILTAITHYQIGYWQDSTHLYRRGVQVTQHNKVAHYNLACTLADEGHHAEAVKHFRLGLHIAPNDPDLHNNLANSLVELGDMNGAKKHLETALRLDPGFAKAHNNYGVLLAKIGKPDEARHQYVRAIEIKSDYAEAYNNLGTLLIRRGQDKKAVHLFTLALKYKTDYAMAHYNMGLSLLRLGKPDRAVRHLQAALRLDPAHDRARQALSKALQKG